MSTEKNKVDAELLNAVANGLIDEAVAQAEKKPKAVRKPRAKKVASAEVGETLPFASTEEKPKRKYTRKKVATTDTAKEAAPKKRCGRPRKSTTTLVPVSFVYRGLPGMKVYVAGEFNDWDPKVFPMLDPQEVGFYSCELMLAPGQYQYKLVINGIWREDPDNSMRIANPFGTDNSLIVVEKP